MIMIESQLERWLKDKGESPYVEDKDVLKFSTLSYTWHTAKQRRNFRIC